MATLERATVFKAYEGGNGLHYIEPWPQPQPAPARHERAGTIVPDVAREVDWSGWERWADAKIANAIAAERAFLLESIGQAIGKLLEQEAASHKRDLAAEVASLKLELAKLHSVLSEFRVAAATERGGIIDLPSPLPARARNDVN
jgi:hypothetical protein